MKKKISIVTFCYNEEGNAENLYQAIKKVMEGLQDRYDYEQIYIDNASKDRTVEIVKGITARDKRVKLIVNNRNFGHIRSPYYGLLQSDGDVSILMASDLQDPPELIPQFLKKWEEGFKVVKGVKNESEETPVMFAIRKAFYGLIGRISDIELTKNFTGFGLYDRSVVQMLRKIQDPYPYFRGLIADLGYPSAIIYFKQPTRKRGVSANNFFTLYDMAMLGITTHSKVPLRFATLLGFVLSGLSFLAALGYLVAKLLFWNSMPMGIAPLLIGMFFFSSIQLLFIGLIGEYVGFIYTQVLKRPIVVERERINFENETPL